MKGVNLRHRSGHSLGHSQGQSTVEFAMTLGLLVSIILFFLQLSLVMAFGSYVHYATFMAARTYQSGASARSRQRERAAEIVTLLLKKGPGQEGIDRWPGLGTGIASGTTPAGATIGAGPQLAQNPVPSFSWQEGVRYTFRSRLLLMPFLRDDASAGGDPISSVDLTAESWLGREPTREECLESVAASTGGRGVVDNGC